ncbi:MAG: family 20 glycosylhydrolase, partial [Gemmatimonadota bacterium]
MTVYRVVPRVLMCCSLAGVPLMAQVPALVPLPSEVQPHGEVYHLPDTVDIAIAPATSRMREIAGELTAALADHGVTTRERAALSARGGITLRVRDPRADDESYHLTATGTGVLVEAPAEAGVLWGVQTLRQLLEPDGTGWQVAGVEVTDAPRYPWRGAMLDVGRHLFSIEYILEHLDWMSRHKLNVFHWHLTEDQGWRLAIDAYPRLTEVGGWRTEADGSRYGGWYSKSDVRRVVARARVLGITVVPEIEMPGHARAALAAYPDLGCTTDSLPVPSNWGVFSDVLCPGKESTFTFLETVLGEVLELFPSHYIHIGGDEVPKQRWIACASCQEIIHRENLGDEHGLQRWMIARIGRWLAERGRVLIGWDEILDGGLPAGAMVQAWQGSDRIAKA